MAILSIPGPPGPAVEPGGEFVLYDTRLALPQLLSEAHRPRSKRKRSIGTELRSARMRGSPAPVHWMPRFSRTRRDAGLVTRAADWIGSQSRSVKAWSITARTASVA